jgi:hypothetical protein
LLVLWGTFEVVRARKLRGQTELVPSAALRPRRPGGGKFGHGYRHFPVYLALRPNSPAARLRYFTHFSPEALRENERHGRSSWGEWGRPVGFTDIGGLLHKQLLTGGRQPDRNSKDWGESELETRIGLFSRTEIEISARMIC